MIKFENLDINYGDKNILSNINGLFEKGKFYGLIGPNGVGKTSLIKALAGLLDFKGEISLNGKSIRDYGEKERGRNLAYLAQIENPPFGFTVRDIISMGRYSALDRYDDNKYIDESIRKMKLEGFQSRKIETLSGGERQRVFLARAFAQNTDILLLDEMMTGLDYHHQYDLIEDLKLWIDDKKIIIGVFHDLNLPLRFADEIYLINSKKKLEKIPKKDFNEEKIGKEFNIDAKIYKDDGISFILPIKSRKKRI